MRLLTVLLALLVWGAAWPVEKAGEVNRRIHRLEAEQQQARRQRDQVSAGLEQTERRIGELALRLRELGGRRTALEQRRQELQQALRELEARRAELQQQLAALVRAAYLGGGHERLRLLFDQRDPAGLQRQLAYHDYLARARARRLREVRRTLEARRRLDEALARQQRALDQVVAEQQAEQARLRRQEQQRRQVLARLERELADRARRLERLRQDRARLARVVARARHRLATLEAPDLEPFAHFRGRLPWPAEGPLAVRFGTEKVANLRWDGVIIRVPEGREVKAVRGGRVAWADWLRGYGLLVILDHGDGYMTLYGHNQALLKRTGDWVTAGEPIALAGRSGGQRRAGIYFGIRHGGKPLDPARWCRRSKRG